MKHLWGALLVLALSAFMPGHLSAQGVSTQTGKAQGAGLELGQNYPNPFNPATNLEFGMSKLGFVTLKVYDLVGKEVAVLVNKDFTTGNYTVDFNASMLPSGAYFYKITAGDFSETKKLILVK